MKSKIKKRLDHYLGFDSDEIFEMGDPIIFGGAIRDSIADLDIHDIDILSGPLTAERLDRLIISHGYKFSENLMIKDMTDMYSGIKIISEPKTYLKSGRIIQVIRPRGNSNQPVNQLNQLFETNYKQVINDLISEVDLSCCGVSYDGKDVYEKFPNAIVHCQSKVYLVNKRAKMKTNRIHGRMHKLSVRGWEEINEIENRDVIINHVLQ